MRQHAQPQQVGDEALSHDRIDDRARVTRRWRITGGRGRERHPADGAPIHGYRRIASMTDHAAAARHVDWLAEQEIDVSGVRVVGTDLAMVQQVHSDRRLWQEILHKMVAGAILGAIVAFFLGLFDPVAPLTSALFGLVFGALLGMAVGALWGAGACLLMRDDRLGRGGLVARSFEVLAPEGSEAAKRSDP